MGNLWFNEEEFRRRYIKDYIGMCPVIFPQTMDYSDTATGREELANSIPIYNDSRLTLVARERESLRLMSEAYPQARILLAPDIVLSCTMSDFGAISQKRVGALLCARRDEEKRIDDTAWALLEQEVKRLGLRVLHTDMHSTSLVTKRNRAELVRAKMQEFCSAELVITDRLHGMVFSAITGTPCIVLPNYNHKVSGTYDWIRYLPYVMYADTVMEATEFIPRLLTMRSCQYNNTPLAPYYAKLKEAINRMPEVH